MTSIVLYCRPGYEKECGAEIQEKAAWSEVYGYITIAKQQGLVFFHVQQVEDAETLIERLPLRKLIFTRQWFIVLVDKLELPDYNRVEAITEALGNDWQYADLRMETADTNDGKALSKFCRKLSVPLRQALRKEKVLTPKGENEGAVLHALFHDGQTVTLGYSYANNTSEHVMGIMRLKFPNQSPSRSTLKLDEAFLTFVPEWERETRITSGMKAVDLGAAPGGWTYQLVRRGMMVTSVDNGPMAESLMETGQVKHLQMDGYKFQPPKPIVHWLSRRLTNGKMVEVPDATPLDWMVCDIIDKPQRSARLIIDWMSQGWCRECIVNLKLPMTKKYETIKEQLQVIRDQIGDRCKVEAKHLYYDRDEITVHVRYLFQRENSR